MEETALALRTKLS